jgi:hypothetical protein
MSGRPFASVLSEGRREASLFVVQSIPVAGIIGSEGRSDDFSRSFLHSVYRIAARP